MTSSSVVGLEPGRKGCRALFVAGEGLSVCPFGWRGWVEAFDFAVLPGAVRLDELLGGVQGGDGVANVVLAVGLRVIGDHPFDSGDAVVGEVGGGPGQECGAGGAFLVGKDFRVGEP